MSAVRRKPPQSSGTDSSLTGAAAGTEGPRGARRPGRRDEARESVHQAVGDREHLVARRLGIPQRGETGASRSGSSAARSTRLGEVGREVEQLPAVLVEVPAADGQLLFVEDTRADVVGRRLPPLVVDRARADHLEVLRRVLTRPRPGPRARRGGWPRRAVAGPPRRPWPARSMPAAAMIVGMRSMTWANWRRTVPGWATWPGQCTMSGVRVPPSQV